MDTNEKKVLLVVNPCSGQSSKRASVEDIIEKFSKILEDIPDSDETWYITDNLNLTREDKSQAKNPEKILRNARIDKDGNLVVKKADWTN